MPVTTWDEIRGYNCVGCGHAATHFYGNAPLCCDCHTDGAGGLVSREEAERENPAPRTKNMVPEVP
jgi:hypothetical protein